MLNNSGRVSVFPVDLIQALDALNRTVTSLGGAFLASALILVSSASRLPASASNNWMSPGSTPNGSPGGRWLACVKWAIPDSAGNVPWMSCAEPSSSAKLG